jgi:hypothetical protein
MPSVISPTASSNPRQKPRRPIGHSDRDHPPNFEDVVPPSPDPDPSPTLPIRIVTDATPQDVEPTGLPASVEYPPHELASRFPPMEPARPNTVQRRMTIAAPKSLVG